MTRAEERALEAYPYNRAYTDNDIEYDGNFCNRLPYMEGYQQAEKDLALTWEDIKNIAYLWLTTKIDYRINGKELSLEVLKKFNEQKKLTE